MSMFISNPENGAEIGEFYFHNVSYFGQEPFAVGTVVKVDDALGKHMLSTWGFLQEVTKEQAQTAVKKEEKFVCECGFEAKSEFGLKAHKRKHENDAEYVPGIKEITATKQDKETNKTETEKRQEAWEAQDKQSGLEGTGLEYE